MSCPNHITHSTQRPGAPLGWEVLTQAHKLVRGGQSREEVPMPWKGIPEVQTPECGPVGMCSPGGRHTLAHGLLP